MKRTLTITSGLLLAISFNMAYAVEFNTTMIDSVDKANIDFDKFSTVGYIVPGRYKMQMLVNGRSLGEFEVSYLAADDINSTICFSQQQLEAIGLKKEQLQTTLATKNKQGCYDLLRLPGVTAQGSLTSYSLTLAVPRAYLENAPDGWDIPSRWDEGVNGVMVDYGINLQYNHASKTDVNRTNLSAYGIAGFNVSTWRVRADWQGQYSQADGEHENSEFKVNRVYGYRALPDITAQLKVGEIDMGSSSSVFDPFSFLGAALTTDENMLPPNLRGYAPEVVGIAKTNAKVVISQQGSTLYETQVAAGPFRIQDLNSYVSGMLDVRVEEQDGSVQTFQVNAATVPYLSRPGFVRYKLASGKAGLGQHDHDGPIFASGEFSWGVDNGWSLFGGALLSDNYQSTVIGMGRDLYHFGAFSVDMTQSWAEWSNEHKSGASYRVNYSKNFEELNSQVTFAGYRFSERDFMTMNDFIEVSKGANYQGNQKELYNVTLSKQFTGSSVGAYINYSHQTFWDDEAHDRVSLSLSSYFDVLGVHDITSSLTAYRSKQNNEHDDGFYLSFTIPFGLAQSVGYSVSSNGTNTSHNMHFNNRIDDRNNYSLTAGTSSRGGADSISGFYSHNGDIVDMTINASHQSGSSSGVGLSLNGGLTVTAEGAALHRGSTSGGARIMIDTGSVTDVPVNSFGPSTRTNRYGKAVMADISSYYRNQTNILVDELSDEVDVIGNPVRSMTLTEGAIGYQKFDMLSGSKRMLQIKRSNGKYVPMAATVYNRKQQPLGMVADEGMVYLAGLQQGESLQVNWGNSHCELTLPTPLPVMDDIAILACR